MPIKRQSLRAQIREELLARLKDGSIEAGTGINEAQLAAELGVSRTPLREALISLEGEGQISSESGKGFRFAPINPKEFEELAPVIGALECLALTLTPPDYLREHAPRLLVMAESFPESVATHREVLERDDQWHGLLVGGCPNERLTSLIDNLKVAVHRYEFEVNPSDALVQRVAAEHIAIAQALLDDDLEGAQAALRLNWINGMARMLARYEPRPD